MSPRRPKSIDKSETVSDWTSRIMRIPNWVRRAVAIIAINTDRDGGEILAQYITEGVKKDIKRLKINLD